MTMNRNERTFHNKCSRDIKITGVTKEKSCWWYQVELTDISKFVPNESQFGLIVPRYSILRRYNDFRNLYMALLPHLNLKKKSPILPDGGIMTFFKASDPSLLKMRKELLQELLRWLDAQPKLRQLPQVIEFLKPDHTSFRKRSQDIEHGSEYVSLSQVTSPQYQFIGKSAEETHWKRRKVDSLSSKLMQRKPSCELHRMMGIEV